MDFLNLGLLRFQIGSHLLFAIHSIRIICRYSITTYLKKTLLKLLISLSVLWRVKLGFRHLRFCLPAEQLCLVGAWILRLQFLQGQGAAFRLVHSNSGAGGEQAAPGHRPIALHRAAVRTQRNCLTHPSVPAPVQLRPSCIYWWPQGDQTMVPQNMILWHKDNFEL